MDNFGNLEIHSDERGGNLIPFNLSDLDFIPKRIFTVSDVPKGQVRGEHAHLETKQVLVCIKGKILVCLDHGDKYTETEIKMGEWIFIDNMVWDSQKFITGNDCMVVICSTEYNINDYIFNKNDFYRLKNDIV